VAYIQGDYIMRNLITAMNTGQYANLQRVVDRDGQTENSACLIQWVAPHWYRVGIWNELDGVWEYTKTLNWLGVVACLTFYGLL
jgi:hypothetical protein